MSNVTTSPAIQRIESLLDEHSFVETGALVTSRNTDFNLDAQKAPSDGVVIGHGTIDGNLVFVFSQDSSVLNGTIGEMHARKIKSVYETAIKVGAPVIGLLDSTGIRLQESVDALEALGSIYAEAVKASGVVPQIMGVFGNCGGGLSILTSISDFTFIAKDGRLFLNSPDAIPGNYTDKLDTASADFQFAHGNADAIGSEDEFFDAIRTLVTLIPGSSLQDGQLDDATDDLNRVAVDLDTARDDARAFAREISDNGLFFETKAGYAREMVTGFIKLGGITVGLVGNSEKAGDEEFAPELTIAGANKAADFVTFCDAFDIPVLSLTDVTGYAASVHAEEFLGKAVGRLVYAFASATVPKISFITKKAVGSAYIAMNSKAIGADLVYALPDAEVGIMDAKLAAKIMYADADASVQSEKASEFEAKQDSVNTAAARGYVDRIVNPEDARKYLIAGFEMLLTKNDDIYKKHGTR